jgi:PPOX class F420-dependent enzyme/OxyR family protein/deazaflavin-dependent oxidoreductase (nitroreductase family)
MSFTDEEVAYIRSQRLARVATVAADGQPDVVPVGYEFDGTYFYIGGMDPANTRRARNIEAGNEKVGYEGDARRIVERQPVRAPAVRPPRPDWSAPHRPPGRIRMTGFDSRRGTRGSRQPKGRLMVWGNAFMAGRVRKGKNPMKFSLLILTTTGRKSGAERAVPVGWFPDGNGNWLVVASANGATDNPAWYYNLAAAARRRARGGLVHHHHHGPPLRRVRGQDRPRDPGHPANPPRCGVIAASLSLPGQVRLAGHRGAAVP